MVPQQTWGHQQPAIEYLNRHRVTALSAVMGSGKSFMTVSHCRSQFAERDSRILILCPAAVRGVWRREFHKHAQDQFDGLVLDGDQRSSKKAEMIAEHLQRQKGRQRPVFVAINYESFWRKEILNALMAARFSKVITDESHRIKSHSATCSKQAWEIVKRGIASRLCLTGTLMPNGPQDIFGQYRFLNDSIFGRYWTHFKRRYAIENPHIPGMITGWINQEELKQKVASIRYHIGPEVLQLPEKSDIVIYCKLDPAGRKAYDEMKKESFVELGVQTENGVPRIASAQNGAVQFLRMLQLAQGYVKDTEQVETVTDTQKRRALLELLEGINEPVCVYGWFRHDIECVKKCCEILGKRYGELSGHRSDLTEHATMPDVDVFAVQCKSGSSGIDLTRSAIGIILNSGLLSPGDYDQMLARQYRPGQTRNVRFIHLVTEKTVETKLIDTRGKKRDLVAAMLADMVEGSEEIEEELPW